MNFEDDEDEQFAGQEPSAPLVDAPAAPSAPSSNTGAVNSKKSKGHDENSAVLDRPNNVNQDDWEEFEDPNSKYEELRAKFSRANQNDNDDDEDEYDHQDDPMANDENQLNAVDREQRKDKPAWKLDQVKANEVTNTPAAPVEEPAEAPRAPSPVKPPASTGAYRPPQLRSGPASVIVSGPPVRVSKKKQPNLASTEDFPTLGSAVNKK